MVLHIEAPIDRALAVQAIPGYLVPSWSHFASSWALQRLAAPLLPTLPLSVLQAQVERIWEEEKPFPEEEEGGCI